jgi:cell division protease FtsH
MTQDSWLPLRFEILPGVFTGRILYREPEYEIREAHGNASRLLVVRLELLDTWVQAGLLAPGDFEKVPGAHEPLAAFPSSRHLISPLAACPTPQDRNEGLAFAGALRRARASMPTATLGTAIFLERLNALLPVPSGKDDQLTDDQVVGRYLCGVPVSCFSIRRITALAPWIPQDDIRAVSAAAGLQPPSTEPSSSPTAHRCFELPGRRSLERFFREHIIDIVEDEESYRVLGVPFPSPLVLHGPPGCGKTYAVDALVDYLDWPSYQVDSTSVGSPYIHETGRKIGAMFEEAGKHAPAVITIDEMDAFLGERGSGSDHRVEEVAEFLRRMSDAQKNRILVVGMTNRIEAVDPAILRRGRFDHVISVDLPSREEVREVLQSNLRQRPCSADLPIDECAAVLAGAPLSDAAFLVREAARLAARAHKHLVDGQSMKEALDVLRRQARDDTPSKIGF